MALRVVVMGVSGCGKSTVGQLLAQSLGLPYIEGDQLHPPRNVALMAAGTPLTDADRQGWLQAVGAQLAAARDSGAVASCSALKRSYRDALRAAVPDVRFVHLHGSPALLAERMNARNGHYMPASLLQSQLEILEPPGPDEAAVTIDIAPPAQQIAALALRHLTGADAMEFTQVILYTDTDGRARFREERIALSEGKPQARLSPLMPSGGLQLRMSPVGFRSGFHCTEHPQWLFVLSGQMEIHLQDGSCRSFGPGQHFYSADTLPAGATFDPGLHGHWSCQAGPDPLVTAFVRA